MALKWLGCNSTTSLRTTQNLTHTILAHQLQTQAWIKIDLHLLYKFFKPTL